MNNNANNITPGLKAARAIYEFIEMVVLAAVVTIMLFMFVGRLTVVDGVSMMNTLHHGEVLAVTNVDKNYERGDIVVFQAPDSHFDAPIVKRVIATGGQTVDIDFENWLVYVDGEPLYTDEDGYFPEVEPYINREAGRMHQYDREFPFVVPEGELFVMGDNRNHSNDSRGTDIDTVDERYIFGKALVRISPFSKFGTID